MKIKVEIDFVKNINKLLLGSLFLVVSAHVSATTVVEYNQNGEDGWTIDCPSGCTAKKESYGMSFVLTGGDLEDSEHDLDAPGLSLAGQGFVELHYSEFVHTNPSIGIDIKTELENSDGNQFAFGLSILNGSATYEGSDNTGLPMDGDAIAVDSGIDLSSGSVGLAWNAGMVVGYHRDSDGFIQYSSNMWNVFDIDPFYDLNGTLNVDNDFEGGSGSVLFESIEYGFGSPSSVPVPATAWLFGSAVIGLVGIKRKK